MHTSQRAAYLGCSLSIGVFSAFNNFTLSLWLSSFTSSYVLISLLGNTRSFEGAIVSPAAGAWSDRAWLGWLGRRRPFILVGGLASALFLAMTPLFGAQPPRSAGSGVLAEIGHLAPTIAVIVLFTLTFNVMDDIHKALLTDLTDGAEQNFLSALSAVVNIGGQVGILVLGFLLWNQSVPASAFILTAALMAAGIALTVLGVAEPSPAVWAAGHGPRQPVRPDASRWDLVRRYPGAAVFFLVSFAYWSGVNSVLPLVSIYTRDILGASVGEAQLLPGLLLLSTTLLAIPLGALGTRYGKRRVISAGYAIMGLAALAGLVITTLEQGAVLFLLAGIGNSATIVLAIPLLADLVPRQHMGTAAGLLAASGSLAAPLASIVAGALSEAYGPRAIFAVMAAMTLVALALMPFTRDPNPVSAGSRQ